MPMLGENPLEFLDETYPAKTREMGLLYGENFIILTSTIFRDTPVWWTDGWTDGRLAIAYSALSIYAICCRALKTLSVRWVFSSKNWLGSQCLNQQCPLSKNLTKQRCCSIMVLVVICTCISNPLWASMLNIYTTGWKTWIFTSSVHSNYNVDVWWLMWTVCNVNTTIIGSWLYYTDSTISHQTVIAVLASQLLLLLCLSTPAGAQATADTPPLRPNGPILCLAFCFAPAQFHASQLLLSFPACRRYTDICLLMAIHWQDVQPSSSA